MSKTVFFLNMFSDYQPPEDLFGYLSQAAITAADIDMERRSVSVTIHAETYIPQKLLIKAAGDIRDAYGLRQLQIEPVYPSTQLQSVGPEDLMQLFVSENSMTRGSLAGASWSWEGETLHIDLMANGKDILLECVPAVRRRLFAMFGVQVQVEIKAGQNLEGKALFEAMDAMRSNLITSLPTNAAAPKKEAAPVDNGAIYGKPFKGKVVPMKDMSLDMGIIIVEGRVFAVEHKELKKRNAWVINFDVTDNTSSVRVSRFLENKEAEPILQGVKNGSVVKIQGKLLVDNYTNETVLKPFAIMPGEMPKRKDLHEGEKRVELHLHTSMSNMDALTNTKSVIKQAAAWGHRAIAITDHGCCQSFTDALHTVEGWGGNLKVAGTDTDFKILHGCEGYYFNDLDDRIVVRGKTDMPFDGEFVAFDLETTGLSSINDRITEVGAVILKDGKEIDRFQTLVDPERLLTAENTELTGITNEMLKGQPKIEEILPKFLEFVGDRPLVAHNAAFDIGFIRAECERQNIKRSFTYADTLILSRILMPQLNKHKLNIVADALSLPEFNHHRAADDAMTCGLIMARFMNMLKEQGIENLQAVNGYVMSMERETPLGKRRPNHIILFAKNQMGLRNLYHLISNSNLKFFKRFPWMPKSEIMKYREGLIIGSACEAGELFKAVIDHKSEEELKDIASFYDFLEIQPRMWKNCGSLTAPSSAWVKNLVSPLWLPVTFTSKIPRTRSSATSSWLPRALMTATSLTPSISVQPMKC